MLRDIRLGNLCKIRKAQNRKEGYEGMLGNLKGRFLDVQELF